MRLSKVLVLVTALLLGLGGTLTSAAHAYANVSVGVNFFDNSLAPYGQWAVSAQFGHVWRPAGVSPGWRPYSHGRWVSTDVGFTFVSSEPWGWATYHYGRWAFDPVLGWIWVPGTEWAPAWVAFSEGDGFIGWAPIPPGFGFDFAFANIDPFAFCFVPQVFFVDVDVFNRIVPVTRNAFLVRRAVNVTRFSRVGGTFVNRSFSPQRIAQVTRRPVPTMRLVNASDPRTSRVSGNQVALFRPRVTATRATQPARISSTVRPRASAMPPRTSRSTARVTSTRQVRQVPPATRMTTTKRSAPPPVNRTVHQGATPQLKQVRASQTMAQRSTAPVRQTVHPQAPRRTVMPQVARASRPQMAVRHQPAPQSTVRSVKAGQQPAQVRQPAPKQRQKPPAQQGKPPAAS